MRFPKRVFFLLLAAIILVGGYVFFVPLSIDKTPAYVDIPPNTSVALITEKIHRSGIALPPMLFELVLVLRGQSKNVQAGYYEVSSGTTLWQLINKIIQGRSVQESITFIEGWTFQQLREALNNSSGLKHDSKAMSDEQLGEKLGIGYKSLEGLFSPDTYHFYRYTSDMIILREAHQAMQNFLQKAWENREADVPYTTPYQALIMASILEKESGRSDERKLIASVFINRLKIGMPLQTDPTVIYGLGGDFDGNLRKKDLSIDSPYNTYVRSGLPPSPISLPGRQSIEAALMPDPSNYLYFVARGDGSSYFSRNINEHNRAVEKYQKKRRVP